MKKRIMALFLAMAMVVTATGCGKGYKVGENGEVYNDYVKIKQWKELEVERVDPIPVTDEDVNMSIETDLQTLVTYVDTKEHAAKMGDKVTIDYLGKQNGVEFEGGKDTNKTLILGQGEFLEKFEEGIVGHKAGEIFDVAFAFPEGYGGDLGGKDVVFTMTLHKVEAEVIPELNDETAKKLNPKAKNVEEYKKLVRENLEELNQEQAELEMKSNLLGKLLEQCEIIEYQEDELEQSIENMTEFMDKQLEEAAAYAGMTAEAYLEAYLEASGLTEELWKEQIEESVKESLLMKYSLELLLDVEKISHTEEDYESFLKEEAEKQGFKDADEVEEALESYYGPGGAEIYFLQMKAVDSLYEYCKIVEPKQTETESETGTDAETENETESTETVTE